MSMLSSVLSKEELQKLYQLSQQEDSIENLEEYLYDNTELAEKLLNHFECLIPLEILNGDGYDPKNPKNRHKIRQGNEPIPFIVRKFLTSEDGKTNELSISYRIVFEGA